MQTARDMKNRSGNLRDPTVWVPRHTGPSRASLIWKERQPEHRKGCLGVSTSSQWLRSWRLLLRVHVSEKRQPECWELSFRKLPCDSKRVLWAYSLHFHRKTVPLGIGRFWERLGLPLVGLGWCRAQHSPAAPCESHLDMEGSGTPPSAGGLR